MPRKFFALPLLALAIVVGPAAADFVLIRINLDKIVLPDLPAQPANQPGTPGGGNFAGGFGAGGGFGAAGGMQGGAGGIGLPNLPMGGRRGPGMNPRRPMPNPAPPPPNPAANPNEPQGEPEADFDPSHPWVGAFIEFKVRQGDAKSLYAVIETRFNSKAILPLDHKIRGDIHYQQVHAEPLAVKFARELKAAVKAKRADKLLELAQDALSHGMTHKDRHHLDAKGAEQKPAFDQALDELAKLDPKHRAIKNVERVRGLLKKPLPDDDLDVKAFVEEMQKDGYRPQPSAQGHYLLLTNLPAIGQSDAMLKRRLHQLEESLANFYLWFALQADLPQPALPKSRLPAVLVGNPQEFRQRHFAWGSPPLADDGFTPRRDNVVILSGKCLDETYTAFAKQMEALTQGLGVSRDELVTGNVWSRTDWKNDQNRQAAYVYLSTLSTVQKVLEDEAELAAVTHEATRQLLVASGLFPRNVQVPEWVLSGLASYFETPVGAVFPSLGQPSWSNLVAFKHYHEEKWFEKPADVLRDVLTDRYFQTAQRTADAAAANRENDTLAGKARRDAELARCTAWAFVYYLAHDRKLSALLRYGQELQQLPRDLELNEQTLEGCFARALNLADPKDARRLDQGRLKRLAENWLSEMQSINLENSEIERLYLEMRQPKEKKADGGS